MLHTACRAMLSYSANAGENRGSSPSAFSAPCQILRSGFAKVSRSDAAYCGAENCAYCLINHALTKLLGAFKEAHDECPLLKYKRRRGLTRKSSK